MLAAAPSPPRCMARDTHFSKTVSFLTIASCPWSSWLSRPHPFGRLGRRFGSGPAASTVLRGPNGLNDLTTAVHRTHREEGRMSKILEHVVHKADVRFAAQTIPAHDGFRVLSYEHLGTLVAEIGEVRPDAVRFDVVIEKEQGVREVVPNRIAGARAEAP